MKIVLFEDEQCADLYPLTFLRPVFDLRCGVFTLKEKIEKKFPNCRVYMETRDELDGVTAEKYGGEVVNSHDAVLADDDMLLVDAGAILTSEAPAYTEGEKVGVTDGGRFVWAYLKRETVERLDSTACIGLAEAATKELSPQIVHDVLIRYPWDLIAHNPEQITRDFAEYYVPERKSEPLRGSAMMGPTENLYIGEDVELQPHTLVDCRKGPVILSDGVLVSAHTSIHGPAFLGEGTRLFEAKIREGCSFGPVCRVGGEVEESIIHGYSNKYHTGFLGHSYVCEWVNLGGMTSNSDLKNDYSNVILQVGGKQVDSGQLKVGCFIGDHTKTSIGTLLNTGSIMGIMCNLVAGPTVLPKYIPSFAWYVQGRISKGLGIDYALRTAEASMSRRGVEATEAMVDLIKHSEEITREERLQLVQKHRKRIR